MENLQAKEQSPDQAEANKKVDHQGGPKEISQEELVTKVKLMVDSLSEEEKKTFDYLTSDEGGKVFGLVNLVRKLPNETRDKVLSDNQ